MAFAPGIGSVSIECFNTNTNRQGFITFGLNIGITPSGEHLSTALSAFMTDIIQDCHTSIISRGALITRNDGSGGTGSTFLPFPDTLIGAQSGNVAPPQVAYLYRKLTDTVGRGSWGRFYLPGVKESEVDATGRVSSAWVTTMQNHAESALTALNSSTSTPYEMLLLHAGSSDPTTVPSLQVEPFVATQRRRLVRAGA